MSERPTMKGKVNIYQCELCRGIIVTKDVDEGVTPFSIDCRATEGCRGLMTSLMYRVAQQTTVTHVWYKPAVLDDLAPHAREHVERGGLIIVPSHEYRREMSAS